MHLQSLLNTCIKYTILILIPMLNHLSTHNYCEIPFHWDVYERRGVSIISPCVMSLIMRKFSSHHRTTQDKQVYYLK